jgi:outer membrane protein OmpA-like peptidoglycan-associated protein
MAESVARLKELLLDTEQRELGQLARRVDQLFERAGTQERMQQSVAQVLDGAFREADSRNHKDLARSVAPVIVSTVKAEIRNSTDDLVEALHPHMGRMVSAYVANAFKDMMARINQRLESGLSARRWMIKFKSLATGRPESELLLAAADRLRIEELFLIRRGSGELVQHWEAVGVGEVAGDPAAAKPNGAALQSNRDAIVSGFLVAINDFAKEAFDHDAARLQTLDIGRDRIYLRTSPSYLLAARCSGTPSGEIESALDGEFLRVLETHRPALSQAAAGISSAELRGVLPDLANGLGRRLEAIDPLAKPGGTRLAWWLLGLIGALVIGWLSWNAHIDWRTERTRAAAVMALDASAMRSYPVRIDVPRGGHLIRLAGLAPSEQDKASLLAAVEKTAAGVRVEESIEVLTQGLPISALQTFKRDVIGGVEESAAAASLLATRRAIERARVRIARLLPELADLDREAGDAATRAKVTTVGAEIRAASSEVDEIARLLEAARGNTIGDGASGRMAEARTRLERAKQVLAEIRGTTYQPPPPRSVAARGEKAAAGLAPVREDAEALATSVDTLGTDVAATERHLLVRTIALLNQRLEQARGARTLTARQEIEEWARANAIFFSVDTAYRDEAQAQRTLEQLSELLKRTRLAVRLVGYTDEIGTQQRNMPLAQDRASKVRQALIERGVAPGQLGIVGRSSGPNLSATTGPSSPNRRVEIEPTFIDETPGGG